MSSLLSLDHILVTLAIVVFGTICAVMAIVRAVQHAGGGHISSIIALVCILGPTFFFLMPSSRGRSGRVPSVQVSSGAASVAFACSVPAVASPLGKQRVVLSGLAIGVFLYLAYLALDGVIRGSIMRPSLVFVAAAFIGLCIAITRVR